VSPGLARLREAPASLDDAAPSRDDCVDTSSGATTTCVADLRQRKLYECTARVRDRLAAVRPTLARLRSVLPPPVGEGTARDADLIVLAAADVARGLVQARRSVRALAGELTDIEAEARELLAIAARIEGGR